MFLSFLFSKCDFFKVLPLQHFPNASTWYTAIGEETRKKRIFALLEEQFFIIHNTRKNCNPSPKVSRIEKFEKFPP